jgi:hypothetical protein
MKRLSAASSLARNKASIKDARVKKAIPLALFAHHGQNNNMGGEYLMGPKNTIVSSCYEI